MTKTPFAIATVLLAAAAGTASAQAPAAKPAAAPAAAAPAAAPAAKPAAAPAPAPAPAAAPAAKPLGTAPAAAPAAKTVAAPAAPAAAPAPAGTAPAAKPAAAPAPAAPAAAPAAGKPAAPAAPAAAAPPPPKPTPSKELEAFMKPMEGSWKCETKFAPGAFGPGSAEVTAKSTVKFKKDFDGMFYRGDYEIKKQKGVDMPMKGTFYIGWDPGTQQVIVAGVDSAGGLGTGAGKIVDGVATYTGEGYMMGMKMKTRETMGAKSPKEGFHKLEIDMGKGFTLMGEDNCKK
jgi:hypothetical protein